MLLQHLSVGDEVVVWRGRHELGHIVGFDKTRRGEVRARVKLRPPASRLRRAVRRVLAKIAGPARVRLPKILAIRG